MAMYVKTEYDGFVAKVLITSDTVGEIDLLSNEFRIEIADQLKASTSSERQKKEAATFVKQKMDSAKWFVEARH